MVGRGVVTESSNTKAAGLKVAVVTGAGSGIGRAVARQFLLHGYAVVLAGRRSAQLLESAEANPNALVVPSDVRIPAEVEHLFSAAVERFGRVDVLFNNAGIFGPAAAVDEISPADWEAVMAVNLTGAMLCAGEAVRVMKKQTPAGGRIINNGSISAHTPRPKSVAYTVSKHAMTGLTKSIDLDGRGFGISCGQIDIGNAATSIMTTLGAATGALQPDGRRLVEPTFPAEEAARAVVMMAELPSEANIASMVITASGMPFGGRG